MKRWRFAIIVVGALVLTLAGTAAARIVVMPATIDEQGAKDAVVAFGEVGTPISVKVSESITPGKPDQFEVLTDNGTTVWVDREGRIRAVHGVVATVAGVELPMDEPTARRVAEAFLAEHHPGFGSMVLCGTVWLSDDAVLFAWGEYAASGARLFREATLTVNCATGRLSTYVARYDSVEGISTDPKIDVDEVTRAFSAEEAYAGARVESCDLEVRRDARGQGRLVWTVVYRPELTGPDGAETFYGLGMYAFYDAATGEEVTAEFP